jgi:hypothetical protein
MGTFTGTGGWGWARRLLALLAVAFGLLTLKAGGTVLFGGPEARAAAGDYVPFVLWFNFLAGFLYIAAGIGMAWGWWWGVRLGAGLAAATLLVFAAFGVHVLLGGAYEARTVIAMTVRSGFWLVAAAVTGRALQTVRGGGRRPQ